MEVLMWCGAVVAFAFSLLLFFVSTAAVVQGIRECVREKRETRWFCADFLGVFLLLLLLSISWIVSSLPAALGFYLIP